MSLESSQERTEQEPPRSLTSTEANHIPAVQGDNRGEQLPANITPAQVPPQPQPASGPPAVLDSHPGLVHLQDLLTGPFRTVDGGRYAGTGDAHTTPTRSASSRTLDVASAATTDSWPAGGGGRLSVSSASRREKRQCRHRTGGSTSADNRLAPNARLGDLADLSSESPPVTERCRRHR